MIVETNSWIILLAVDLFHFVYFSVGEFCFAECYVAMSVCRHQGHSVVSVLHDYDYNINLHFTSPPVIIGPNNNNKPTISSAP